MAKQLVRNHRDKPEETTKVCMVCGEPFYRRTGEALVYYKKRKFCSYTCKAYTQRQRLSFSL